MDANDETGKIGRGMSKMIRGTRLLLFAAALVFVTVNCAGIRTLITGEPHLRLDEVPREVRDIYSNAEKSFENRELEKAFAQYGQIIDYISQGPVVLWSHTRRGEILALKGDYEGSVRELRMVKQRFDDDPFYAEAQYHLARSYSALGQYSQSKKIAEVLLHQKLSSNRRIGLLTLLGDILLTENRPYDAFLRYMEALKEKPDKAMAEQIKSSVEDIVSRRLSLEEQTAAWDSHGSGYPAGYILYALMQSYYATGDVVNTKKYLKEYMTRFKDHPNYDDARALQDRFSAMEVVDRYALGCILPLSGQFAHFGSMALDSVALAAGVFDPLPGPVRIIVEDSRSDPETARERVVTLFSEHKVIGIIGPMGSMVATEAAREAQKLGVPIMTMTQLDEITTIGDYVFRNFLTAKMQIKTLVRYAVENLGMKSFAILYPEDSYGVRMMNLFWDEVIAAGGEIRGAEGYDKKKTDFSDEIKLLTGSAFNDDGDRKEVPQPVIDFDALFIPDSYARVSMIAPQLAFYDVTGIQLLGTNALNSPDLMKGENEYLYGTIFVDGFFLNSYYPAVRNFVDRFYVAYGREPTDVDALVYDAARVMVTCMTDSRIEVRNDLKEALEQLRNYPGVTGMTSFTDGDAEKSLSVLMIRNNDIIQVK